MTAPALFLAAGSLALWAAVFALLRAEGWPVTGAGLVATCITLGLLAVFLILAA